MRGAVPPGGVPHRMRRPAWRDRDAVERSCNGRCNGLDRLAEARVRRPQELNARPSPALRAACRAGPSLRAGCVRRNGRACGVMTAGRGPHDRPAASVFPWSTAGGREAGARPDVWITGCMADADDERDYPWEPCSGDAGPSPAYGRARRRGRGDGRPGRTGPHGAGYRSGVRRCDALRAPRRGTPQRRTGGSRPTGATTAETPREGDIPGPGENPLRNASVGTERRPEHPAGSGGAPFGETARCEGWGTTTDHLRNGPTSPTIRRLSPKGAFPWTTATTGMANTASAPRSPRHAPFRGEPGTFPPRNRRARRSEHGAVFPRQMTETSISAGASRKILSAMRSIRPSQPYASPAAKSTMRVASAVAMPATSMTTAQPSRKC